MNYGIAWDDSPENPNPHAWNVHQDRYETEEAAIAAAEEAVAEWEGEDGPSDIAWLVVWINPEVQS
jgi:hypothetical protein